MLPCSGSYSKDARPIIMANCAMSGCHTSGATFGDFTGYEGLKTKVDNGKFYKLVLETKVMPPNSSLTPEQLKILKCWFDDGAKNN